LAQVAQTLQETIQFLTQSLQTAVVAAATLIPLELVVLVVVLVIQAEQVALQPKETQAEQLALVITVVHLELVTTQQVAVEQVLLAELEFLAFQVMVVLVVFIGTAAVLQQLTQVVVVVVLMVQLLLELVAQEAAVMVQKLVQVQTAQ
jgi:hypothetical protein